MDINNGVPVSDIRELFERIKDRKETSIFELAWDSCPTMIFIKDLNNTLVKVNSSLCKEMGLTKSEVELKNPEEYGWSDEQVRKYFENDLDVIRMGEPKLNIRETLNGKPVITNKYPIFDNNDEVIGILGFANKE